MTRPKPPCETVLPWLRSNLGKHCLAGLTHTDMRALKAAVMLIDLFSYGRDGNVLKAFELTVLQMQANQRYLAYHAIAHVMDWSDRDAIWNCISVGVTTQSKCKYEPSEVYT